jgi:microcin C transport system substrate-binding protein
MRDELLLSRRRFLATASLAAAGASLSVGVGRAQPAPAEWRHALSLMGTPRYPAGFAKFDYTNATAPKGGVTRFSTVSAFDSFNFLIPRGVITPGIGLIYQTLMTSSSDEVATEYGLIADGAQHPANYSSVTYRLNPAARWHDGRPITVEDVIWTFETTKRLNPSRAFYYRNVTKVEATGERAVTFTFDQAGNREKPQIIGQLIIMPKHWWEGTDAQGRPRDPSQSSLEPPLGSGAYRVKAIVPGRTVAYERVPDAWAVNHPTMLGKHNFDEIRYEVFRDETVALEAFKADTYDWRQENRALLWATGYDFPAMRDNRVVREEFPIRNRGVMQSFAFNTRRPRFRDWRVRLACNFAFDFEEANRGLFYGYYSRISSYFHGTELASSGLPTGRELEILETVRNRVPEEVFTRPFVNPVGGTADAVRNNLREAARLLQAAGFVVRDRRLVDQRTGEPFRFEILLVSPAFERIALPYRQALERLGMEVSIRVVEASQYVTRLRSRDFDVIVQSWGQSLSPGNEQREYWGSESADREGSQNVVGIKDPAIDALIERVIFATDRADLIAATRALDRVLLWNHFVVPQWTLGRMWTARWDRFGRPAELPIYEEGFPEIWWWDAEKARRVGGRT